MFAFNFMFHSKRLKCHDLNCFEINRESLPSTSAYNTAALHFTFTQKAQFSFTTFYDVFEKNISQEFLLFINHIQFVVKEERSEILFHKYQVSEEYNINFSRTQCNQIRNAWKASFRFTRRTSIAKFTLWYLYLFCQFFDQILLPSGCCKISFQQLRTQTMSSKVHRKTFQTVRKWIGSLELPHVSIKIDLLREFSKNC